MQDLGSESVTISTKVCGVQASASAISTILVCIRAQCFLAEDPSRIVIIKTAVSWEEQPCVCTRE